MLIGYCGDLHKLFFGGKITWSIVGILSTNDYNGMIQTLWTNYLGLFKVIWLILPIGNPPEMRNLESEYVFFERALRQIQDSLYLFVESQSSMISHFYG